MLERIKNILPSKKVHNKSPHGRKLKRKILAGLFFLIIIVVAIISYLFIFHDLPSPNSLKDYKSFPLSSHIYDRKGKLLYEIFSEENRTPVTLSDLPKYVAQASIAIEDKDFYSHVGVSITSGVLRAVRDMFFTKNLQGGSTLTQQLVKGALLTSDRTVQRKIKEIVLAIWAEQIFKKNEILEMYLNQVPYGGSAYGIEEASKTYFDKKAKELTIAESAMLAGLPQAPSLYSPYVNPDLALERRNAVLQKMFEQKFITKLQFDQAKNTPIKVKPLSVAIKAPHFVFFVKSELEKEYGIQTVEEGGLRIYTTLDLDIQEESEKILSEELEKVKQLQVSNGGILVTRPPTGEILAMVGSVNYFATSSGAFNVTTALRQPGSSLKPLVYAVGIDTKVVTPASILLDTKTCFPSGIGKPYCPVNYDGSFHGLTNIRNSLANSYNIPAVKMLGYIGVEEFVSSASGMTISTFTDARRYGLSLALGGGEVRMTELAQAYSTLANRGKPVRLNSILKVTDKLGNTLYEFKDFNYQNDVREPVKRPNSLTIPGKTVLSREASFLISHILQDNGARSSAFGAGSFLEIKGRSVSVKTGTTDDKKDNWTIGYTPNFLTAVWVGNNDNSAMNPYLTSGITGAAPIWNRVMKTILEKQPDLRQIQPDSLRLRLVCKETGLLAGKNPDGTDSCQTYNEYLINGTENVKTLTTGRMTIPVNRDTGKMTTLDDPANEMQEKTVLKDKYSTFCLDCAQDPQPTPGH